MARHCRRHALAQRLHGHPEGRRIFAKDFAEERRQVVEVMKRNAAHPGLRETVCWLDEALAGVIATMRAGQPNTGADRELCRVASAGVKAEAIIAAVCALYVFAHRRPYSLPDDERLTYAMGYAVSLLAPRPLKDKRRYRGQERRVYEHVSGQTRGAIGRWLRDELAPLLHNVHMAADRLAAQPVQRRRSMAVPLT